MCVTLMWFPSLKEQYIFIHDAVLEYLTCGDTDICAEKLQRTLRGDISSTTTIEVTRLQKQFTVKLSLENSHAVTLMHYLLLCRH